MKNTNVQKKRIKELLDLLKWNISDCKKEISKSQRDCNYTRCIDLEARLDCMDYLLQEAKRIFKDK